MPFENEPGGIALAEWLALINADASVERLDHIWGRNPQTGERLKVPLPGGIKLGLQPIWWHNGEVVGQWLDAKAVERAKQWAQALQAECIASRD